MNEGNFPTPTDETLSLSATQETDHDLAEITALVGEENGVGQAATPDANQAEFEEKKDTITPTHKKRTIELSQLATGGNTIDFAKTKQLLDFLGQSTQLQFELDQDHDFAEAFTKLTELLQTDQTVQVEQIKDLTAVLQGQEAPVEITEEVVIEAQNLSSVVRDGDTLEIARPTQEGEEKIVVRKMDFLVALAVVGFSDAFFKTRFIESIGAKSLGDGVIRPILVNFGVDVPANAFANFYEGGTDDALYQLLDSFSSQQFTDWAEKAVDKNYLFSVLKRFNETDLQKMFTTPEPTPFGSGGRLFGRDHLEITHELADRMYSTLTDWQKRELQISTRPVLR